MRGIFPAYQGLMQVRDLRLSNGNKVWRPARNTAQQRSFFVSASLSASPRGGAAHHLAPQNAFIFDY